MELPHHIIDLLEDYRLARSCQEQAKRDYATANTAFVQTPDDATRDALDARMDALTHTARTTLLKAEAVAAALDLWQQQHKGALAGKTTADPASWKW